MIAIKYKLFARSKSCAPIMPGILEIIRTLIFNFQSRCSQKNKSQCIMVIDM